MSRLKTFAAVVLAATLPAMAQAADFNLSGGSVLGSGCLIKSGVVINKCRLGNQVTIGANAGLTNCRLADGSRVAPLTALDQT